MAKMGPSRRMQKQGPPEPLTDAQLGKKRKATSEKSEPPAKKKKQLNGAPRPAARPAKQPVKPLKSALKQPKQSKPQAVSQQTNGAKKPQPKKAPLLSKVDADGIDGDDFGGLSDEEADGDNALDSADGIDDPDILSDEHNDPSVDRLEDAELADDSGSDPLDSQDEEQDRKDGGMWSDDDMSGSEVDLNAANIQGLSAHLDAKAASEAAAAQAELEEAALQTNIAGDGVPDLESDDEDAHLRSQLAPRPEMLRQRMTETIRILSDFSKHKKATNDPRARSEYMSRLLKDICTYYGYNEFLASKLLSLFNPSEAFAFFEANETERPRVIRTNTLKTHRRALAQALINRGFTIEPVGKWSKVGLQVFQAPEKGGTGNTPEYLAGHYINQAASSFLPVMALAPQDGERVLDMAAAPGGKTTHMAALMHNTGTIFANDPNKSRAKGLIGNIARLGVKNAVVSSCDALEWPKFMWGGLDRVLLDAPCSGTGVIAKDSTIKSGKHEQDFIRLPELQKKLLLAAIDCVDHTSKTGGYLVYSTCSVTVEENEAVVAYALRRRPNIKIVETGLPFGREGFTAHERYRFPDQMKMTRRYYPHAYNVDGFFVCKLRKAGPTVRGATGATKSEEAPAQKERVKGSGAKTTPVEVNGVAKSVAEEGSDFGGFSEEEDQDFMKKAKRRAMRKKGLDPRADRRKARPKAVVNEKTAPIKK